MSPPMDKRKLKWANHNYNFQNSFHTLLQQETLVDVTIIAGQQKLKCHKVVLSACSPYFERLFQDNPCQHPTIVMHETAYWVVHLLITFIYKGEVSLDVSLIPRFIKTAKSLQIKGLSHLSKSDILDFTTNDDASTNKNTAKSIIVSNDCIKTTEITASNNKDKIKRPFIRNHSQSKQGPSNKKPRNDISDHPSDISSTSNKLSKTNSNSEHTKENITNLDINKDETQADIPTTHVIDTLKVNDKLLEGSIQEIELLPDVMKMALKECFENEEVSRFSRFRTYIFFKKTGIYIFPTPTPFTDFTNFP